MNTVRSLNFRNVSNLHVYTNHVSICLLKCRFSLHFNKVCFVLFLKFLFGIGPKSLPNKVPGATAAAGRGPHLEQQGFLMIHLFVNSTKKEKKKSPGDSQEQARPVDVNSNT